MNGVTGFDNIKSIFTVVLYSKIIYLGIKFEENKDWKMFLEHLVDSFEIL